MAVDYRCCETNFFVHILIVTLLVLFASLMSGLTLGLMSMSLVDLEVIAKSELQRIGTTQVHVIERDLMEPDRIVDEYLSTSICSPQDT